MPDSGMTFQSIAVRPVSRGRVELDTTDPLAPPRLWPGFCEADESTRTPALPLAPALTRTPIATLSLPLPLTLALTLSLSLTLTRPMMTSPPCAKASASLTLTQP